MKTKTAPKELVDQDGTTYRRSDLLSTGSTLLNLALSGCVEGGFLKGKYHFIVGDSKSGKTFLSMTCLAEATINPVFKNYRFIYDNIEDGMLMNLDKLFNDEVADRMSPPAGTSSDPIYSDTIASFYYNLDEALLKAGWDTKTRKYKPDENSQPFVYILDSMDSLDDEAEDKKFLQHKAQFLRRRGETTEKNEGEEGEKEKKIAGSYGMGKAKSNSQNIRRAMKGLRQTGSILIIISQTRDNADSMWGGKTRGGGHALRFYNHLEFWSSIKKQLTKDIKLGEDMPSKTREIGTKIELSVQKNRLTGKCRKVTVDIYPDSGIDDIGSCVDFLIDEGAWPKEKNSYVTDGLKPPIRATRDKIISLIEERGLEAEVRKLVGDLWGRIEDALAVRRKNKYRTADKAGPESPEQDHQEDGGESSKNSE